METMVPPLPTEDPCSRTIEQQSLRPLTECNSVLHTWLRPSQSVGVGRTGDDPICLDDDDEESALQKVPNNLVAHVAQSSQQPSLPTLLDSSADSGQKGGEQKCHDKRKKRQRPTNEATSHLINNACDDPFVASDSDSESGSSEFGPRRRHLTLAKFHFPVGDRSHHKVTSTRDSQSGTVTFHILDDSEDDDQINVVDIADDSDSEVPEEAFLPGCKTGAPQASGLNNDSSVDVAHFLNCSPNLDNSNSIKIGRVFVKSENDESACVLKTPDPPGKTSEVPDKVDMVAYWAQKVPPGQQNSSPPDIGEADEEVPSRWAATTDSHMNVADSNIADDTNECSIQRLPRTLNEDEDWNMAEGNQYSDDETSSPDDSTDNSCPCNEIDVRRRHTASEIAPIQLSFGSSQGRSSSLQPLPPDQPLPQQQMHELLRPPPLRRSLQQDSLHTPVQFKALLFPSPTQRDGTCSPKPTNLLKAWNEMARRLRERQEIIDDITSDDDDTEQTKTQRKASTSLYPLGLAEDMGFQGGVDPPISSKQRSHDLGAMEFVPMYDKQYIDERTGLPCRKFTVIGFPDHIIYSFMLEVRVSSIPNAGYGLFLKFLGAKELLPSRQRRAIEIEKIRPPITNSLFDVLSTYHPHGFGMNLTLSGDNLKAPYNSLYALRSLKMTLPDDRAHDRKKSTRKVTLKFADPEIPYDTDELEGLRNPDQRIGHYGLHTEDDFVDAPKRTFSSLHNNCGFIDIGRYGPFLKGDRKIELNFDVKNFLFGFEPGMWSFGVPEKIMGRDQVVDITDDLTGEPHDEARRNLAMYVNEVGHNHSLQETIHALEEDDRTIKYFLMIDNCMKKGDEMEVFVNYKERYEENRERKGYGAKNLSGAIQGDDHLPSRLRRNFVDRQEVLGSIQEADAMDLYLLVDFCVDLGQNLQALLNNFLTRAKFGFEDSSTSPVTAMQITAMRRLDWLVPLLLERCNHLRESLAPMTKNAAYYLLRQCDVSLSQMLWGRWSEILVVLHRNPWMMDKKQKNLRTSLGEEAVEEICFEVSTKLSMPLDESRWCPVAIDMTYDLCIATAKALWQNGDRRALAKTFFKIISKAAEEIKNPMDCNRLSFNLKFEDPFVSRTESNGTGVANIKTEDVAKFVVTKSICGEALPGTDVLMGHTSSMDVAANQMEIIQTTWYLARQIYFVAVVLSQVTLAEESSFTRDRLLSLLGIDSLVGQAALDKDVLSPPRGCITEKPRTRRKQYQELSKKSCAKSAKKDVCSKERVNSNLFWQIIWSSLKDDHGWQLEHGNREHDFYALPPGVARGKGFRNRIDFFDSVPQVLEFLKTNSTWSTNPLIQRCLDEYYFCKEMYDNLVSSRRLPKFDDRKEMVDWLRSKAKERLLSN